MKIRAYAFAVLALAACDSPVDKCSPTSECVGGEPDLAVAEVTMTSTVRDANGLAVVQPNAIDVRIVVRNDGTAASEEKPLQIKARNGTELLMVLAPMKPGEERARTIHVPAPAAGSFLLDTDTTSMIVSIVGLDTNRSNDQRASAPFHLALPALHVTTTINADALIADTQLPATVRIENVSEYAPLSSATLSYCIYDLGGVCSATFRSTLFGSVTVPQLAPRETVVLDHPIAVPASATSHNVVDAYTIGTCIAAGAALAGTNGNAGLCASVRDIAVRPDYETCNPVALEADRPTPGVPVCVSPCEIVAFSVEAQTGHTYIVETTEGTEDIMLRWRTRYRDNPVDASPDAGFQPAVSGKYYLVTAAKYCGDPGVRKPVVLRDIREGAPQGVRR